MTFPWYGEDPSLHAHIIAGMTTYDPRIRPARRWGHALAGAVILLPAIAIAGAISDARVLAATQTSTFSSSGESVYAIPAGTYSLQVTVIGSAGTTVGGNPEHSDGAPGRGAEVQAAISPPTGISTLYVEVGNAIASGGYGGGGTSDYGGGGGGASDVQTCAVGGSGCTYTANPTTDPRLVVAGGGGGGGEDTFSSDASVGGAGGGAGSLGTALSGPGAGGSGTASGNGQPGGGAGLASSAAAAAAGSAASSCPGGTGGVGTPGQGGIGQDNVDGDGSMGGGGGGGWVGGSGGGEGDCSMAGGSGGAGGAGASFVEATATGVSVTTASTGAEVVITATYLTSPVITSASTTTFTSGDAGTFTIQTTGAPTPSLDDGGATLPSGVTFIDNQNGTATLAGTPAAGTGGTYAFTITASNGTNPAATQSFILTVDQAPAITSAATTTFALGTSGSFTVTTTGFPVDTISDGSAALPGGVTFADNHNGTATLAGTPATGSGGVYDFTITAGNGVSPVGSQGFSLTVDQAPAITSADATGFTVGAPGSFTVVTTSFPVDAISDGGATLPSGVNFVDNHDGTATLSGTGAPGTVGTYTFTITASNGVTPAATQSFTLTVGQAATTTVLSSSVNPAKVGQTMTLTASVTVTSPASGTPTGTTSFDDGGSAIAGCSAQPLSLGAATCVASFAGSGAHSLTAVYSGDRNFTESTAPTLVETVDAAATTSILASNANPSVTGQTVTYTATLERAEPASGDPGGTVSFSDGSAPISACVGVALTAGTAACSVTYDATGPHSITATYSGDSDDLGSAATLTQAVGQSATAVTVSSSPNPSVPGEPVTVTVTVAALAPGSGNPSGTVTVFVDGSLVGTSTLNSDVDSQASLTVTGLTIGSHSVTATYSGDAGYAAGASEATADSQQVEAPISTPTTGAFGGGGEASEIGVGLIGLGLLVLDWRRRRSGRSRDAAQ